MLGFVLSSFVLFLRQAATKAACFVLKYESHCVAYADPLFQNFAVVVVVFKTGLLCDVLEILKHSKDRRAGSHL